MKNNAYNQFIAAAQHELRYAVKTCNEAPIAYSYLRFSSPAQAEGDSVRRQTSLRDAWLKRHPDVRLDSTLRLVDAGVSGYTGRHRKNGKHALAQFLDLVERGRVPAGSFLICESLDRLTREEPEESIPVVLNLIKAGVRVVQLVPTEMVYEPGMDFGRLMMMLWELARGHGESKRKSGLLGEVWMTKKEQARAKKTPHGRMGPAWLELVDGAYRVKGDAAVTIRKVFELCAAGLGTLAILERFNREGVPPIGSSGAWHRSYLQSLLGNRAVLGEYQPHKGTHGQVRVAEGEPVEGFYPRIIDDDLWCRAQNAIKERARRRGGRPTTTAFNPFSGLLYDALDGKKLHTVTTHGGAGGAYKYLVSAGVMQKKKGAQWRSFPLVPFVDAVLGQLQELKASELFADPSAEKEKKIGDRLREVEKRLDAARAKFDADPESPTWSDMVTRYDREKRALVKQQAEARMEAANPLSGSWNEVVVMIAEKEPERLRGALLATVEGIWCVFVGRGKVRIAGVQVWFKGNAHRDYIIVHRGGNGGAVGARAPRWWARSLADAAQLGPLDLRKQKDARDLEKLLAEVDLDALTDE